MSAMLPCGCRRETPSTLDGQFAVVGIVRSTDGSPLANARVRFKATRLMTHSDENGRFVFRQMPDRSSTIITAAAADHFIGSCELRAGTDHVIELKPIPKNDCSEYRWVDSRPNSESPGNCGNCHPGIFEQWQSGAHANPVDDYHFRELYADDDYDATSPNDDGFAWSLIHERPDGIGVCTSCHAPAASLELLATGDIRDVDEVARLGIHCDYCHKVKSVSTAHVGVTHGRFAMELRRPEQDQLFFGPLDDVDRGEDVYSELHTRSEFCASCHEGVLFGVHVYSTYSEWLQSPARRQGQQCQDCHMKPDGTTNIARGAGGIERDPNTLASHRLFDPGKKAMLQNAIEIDVTANQRADELIEVVVSLHVKNAGHRVPTGFVDRHLILVVDAFDAAGQLVPVEHGERLDSECGSFAGRAGKLFAKRLIGNSGQVPTPFWQDPIKVEDNRLDPESTTHERFTFSRSVESTRVRLIYRPFWESVQKKKEWPDESIVLYDQQQSISNLPPTGIQGDAP